MPAKMRWVGEGAFQGVIRLPQPLREGGEVDVEDLQAAGVQPCQSFVSLDQPQGSALLRARLGQDQRSGGKVECPETGPFGNGPAFSVPAQSSGNHQMDDDEEVAFQLEHDLLCKAPEARHDAAAELVDRWRHRPQHEGTRQAYRFQPFAGDTPVEVLQVDGEVG